MCVQYVCACVRGIVDLRVCLSVHGLPSYWLPLASARFTSAFSPVTETASSQGYPGEPRGEEHRRELERNRFLNPKQVTRDQTSAGTTSH